jgi:hypothetical protein
MFIVTEDPTTPEGFEKARRKKNLFAVFPHMVGGFVVADHFSFCIDRGDRTRPVHLHLTEYNPLKMIPGQGTVSRVENYIEASIDAVPRDADAFRDRVVHNKNLKNLSGSEGDGGGGRGRANPLRKALVGSPPAEAGGLRGARQWQQQQQWQRQRRCPPLHGLHL